MTRRFSGKRFTSMLAVLSILPLLGLRCPSMNPIDDPNGDPNGGNNGNNGNTGNPNPNGNFVPAIDQSGPIALTVQRNSTCVGQGNQHTLKAADGDDAASSLTWYVRIAPQHGVAAFVGGSTGETVVVCYTPTPSQSQGDSFSIGVYDPKGDIDFVDFNVTVNNSGPSITPPASTTLNIGQNSSNCGAANRITLSATDPDGAGDELEWSVQTAPNHGAVTLPAGKFGGSVPFCYTPNSNQTNSDSFVVKVQDEEGLSAAITINVNVSNTPPNITTGGPPNLIVWKDSPCSSPFNVATVTADDPDAEESLLTWSIFTLPAHGSAGIVGSASGGSIQVCYDTLAEGNTAPDSFIVRVADATGGTATVAVNIEIRTPPQGGRYDGTTSQNLPITFQMVDGPEPKLIEYQIEVDTCPSPACCLGTFELGCHPPLPCDPVLIAPTATFTAGVMPVAVTGSFDAAGNASGGAHAQISTSNPNCPSNPVVTDVTWTAVRTGP